MQFQKTSYIHLTAILGFFVVLFYVGNLYAAEPAPVSASYNAHTNQLTVEFNHNLDDSKLGSHAPPGMTLSADKVVFLLAQLFSLIFQLWSMTILLPTSWMFSKQTNLRACSTWKPTWSWIFYLARLLLSVGNNFPNPQLTFVDNFHVTNWG